MRLFVLLAVALLIVAFVAWQVPTAVLSIAWGGWLILGILSLTIAKLLGGYTVGVPVGTRQAQA